MKSLKIKLNVTYCFVQALYWMGFCAYLSCASAYLAACGYSGTVTGILLALSYGISVFLQQLLATFLDTHKKPGLIGLTNIVSLIAAAAAFCMGFLKEKSIALSVLFVVSAVLCMSIQPLVNAICFHLQKTGVAVNFGVARSMGSVAFSGISVLIGIFIDSHKVNYVPLSGMAVTLLMVVALVISNVFAKGYIKDETKDENKDNTVVENPVFSGLIKKYKFFFIYLIGIACFSYGHQIINGFLHYIVDAVGGTDTDMGGLLAFQAIVELPAMIFFAKLSKKFSTKKLLIVAATAYSLKAVATLVSVNIGMLYFSMIFQALGFAIFIPGGVQLVHETMDAKDAVKGQAFVTGAVTIANFVACITGGFLVDNLGVRMALVIGLAVSIIGTVVSFGSLKEQSRR